MSTIMSRSGAKSWWGIDLPKEIAYLYKDTFDRDWQKVTYKEILDRKIENQNGELERKRAFDKMIPCFIWVFCNEQDFPFGGWWIYIVALKKEWAINFRHDRNDRLVEKAMSLFPCGVLPLKENFDTWAEKFSKQYYNDTFNNGKRKQGLKMCYAEITAYDKLTDLHLKN